MSGQVTQALPVSRDGISRVLRAHAVQRGESVFPRLARSLVERTKGIKI